MYNDRQDLLDRLLKQELISLKRKCFPNKHQPFIWRDITIVPGDISESLQASGLYEKVEDKHKYDYAHKITIDNKLIDKYLNFKPTAWDKLFRQGKKYYKNKIRKVIVHELVHAFCQERYDDWSQIEGCHKDASPIFMSVLYFCNGITTHKCLEAFKKSELYKKISQFKTFEELDNYLTLLLLEYTRIKKQLQQGKQIGKSLVINKFEFSSRHAGIEKFSQFKNELLCSKDNNVKSLEYNTFHVGCAILPEQIEPLINKKRYSNFPYYEYKKVAVTNNGTKLNTLYRKACGF